MVTYCYCTLLGIVSICLSYAEKMQSLFGHDVLFL